MKIAIFKRMCVDFSFEVIGDSNSYKDDERYARISEYVDVEFPPLSTSELVQKQLAAIDHTETELRNKFQSALNGIERSRAELMALPNLEPVS